MTTSEDRVNRLEALLDRVRRRATEARRPLARLLGTAPAPSDAREEEPLPPPVRDLPPVAARAPEPNPVPFTVVPATLELVDTPPPESLGEDDILDEIPSDMLESVPPSGGTVDVRAADSEEEEPEPPASSQRPRSSAMLDDGLLGMAPEPLLDEGREVPLKTPPPESGPQEAPLPSGFGAPHVPDDVDGLLEADLAPPAALHDGGLGFEALEAPFGASLPAPAVPAPGPTVEQLGQTIDLEEGGTGPSLELDAPPASAPPPSAKPEELEVPLPSRESAGRYDAELMPPPEAREDLEAHLEKVGESLPLEAPAPATIEAFTPSAPATPPFAPEPAVSEVTNAEVSAAAGPEVIGRPPFESGVVFTVRPSDQPLARPSTFLELLDGSIALGG